MATPSQEQLHPDTASKFRQQQDTRHTFNARATYNLTEKQQKVRDQASRYVDRAGSFVKNQGRSFNKVGRRTMSDGQVDTLPLRQLGAGLYTGGNIAKSQAKRIAGTAKVTAISSLTLAWSSFWWFINAALSIICIFFLALYSTTPASLGDAAISFTIGGYPVETVWDIFLISWVALFASVLCMYVVAIGSYKAAGISPLEGSLQTLSFIFSFILNIIPGCAAIFHWMSIWIFTINIYSKIE
jgi:hypothetical protein